MMSTSLHQVELTSRCNLACIYCLHPIMRRPKIDMDEATWARCLVWLRHFVGAGTQGDLVLTGTGEPTLHPLLTTYAAQAREIVGPQVRMLATTNGIAMTQAIADACVPLNIRWYVSTHRPEKAAPAVHMLARAGLLERAVMDPVGEYGNSWAGQVDWYDPMVDDRRRKPVCPWLAAGWAFVASDGTIYDCCYADADAPVRGHVTDAPHAIIPYEHEKCGACWQRPPAGNERAGTICR